ncbi:MAG TPA: membrane protein insertion efficiency factor YidD [Thermoanaerobaculia bacterium]
MKRPSLAASILGATIAIAAVVAVHDASTPVNRQMTTRMAIGSIEQYRRHISPRMQGVVRCRFQPSCSAYGLEAVKRYGAFRGGWRAMKRVARCTPATPMGTVDSLE